MPIDNDGVDLASCALIVFTFYTAVGMSTTTAAYTANYAAATALEALPTQSLYELRDEHPTPKRCRCEDLEGVHVIDDDALVLVSLRRVAHSIALPCFQCCPRDLCLLFEMQIKSDMVKRLVQMRDLATGLIM